MRGGLLGAALDERLEGLQAVLSHFVVLTAAVLLDDGHHPLNVLAEAVARLTAGTSTNTFRSGNGQTLIDDSERQFSKKIAPVDI